MLGNISMALEALSSNEIIVDYIVHDTISADPIFVAEDSSSSSWLKKKKPPPEEVVQVVEGGALDSSSSCCCMMRQQLTRRCCHLGKAAAAAEEELASRKNYAAGPGGVTTVQGRRKKRERRTKKICKNKEKAETQRMTHIVVERNRRKQMNDHLAVLRSLMPETYVHRGDQASIVGGAIDYVKELERLLQSLEAQKFLPRHRGGGTLQPPTGTTTTTTTAAAEFLEAPFAQFFACPQFIWSLPSSRLSETAAAAVADIEVTLIETHANLRILCRRNPRQLSKLVTGFQTMYLTILHLNVTTLDPLVLYSISAKVEGLCQLTSPDEIAAAVHHMLRIIEEEPIQC